MIVCVGGWGGGREAGRDRERVDRRHKESTDSCIIINDLRSVSNLTGST